MKNIKAFTLIEVLVAVVIFAVGFLGLAGLQLSALRDSHSAYLRSQATNLANDIIERIRANYIPPSQNSSLNTISEGYYDASSGFSGAYHINDCVSPAGKTANGCSSQEMAEHDYFEWQQLVRNTLPNGTGIVCFDATPIDKPAAKPVGGFGCDGGGAPVYTIKIWWNEAIDNDTADNTSGSDTGQQIFVTSFNPGA